MTHVIYPITEALHMGLKILTNKISKCAQVVFQTVIVPTVEAFNKTLCKVASHTYYLVRTIQNSLTDLLVKLEKAFRRAQLS